MEEKRREQGKESKIEINPNNICVCLFQDGQIGLFQENRVFDIQYSAWVSVCYGIDFKGNPTNQIAILGKKGDKVFPEEKWLETGEYIITREQERIKATCSVVKGQNLFHIMLQNSKNMYQGNNMTASELAKILKKVKQDFRFEKPKQNIKK